LFCFFAFKIEDVAKKNNHLVVFAVPVVSCDSFFLFVSEAFKHPKNLFQERSNFFIEKCEKKMKMWYLSLSVLIPNPTRLIRNQRKIEELQPGLLVGLTPPRRGELVKLPATWREKKAEFIYWELLLFNVLGIVKIHQSRTYTIKTI